MKFVAVFAFVLLAGCANPYAVFYHPSANAATAMKAYIPSSAALAIYTTNDFPKDVDALVRRGYFPVGNSSFNANSKSVNESQLRAQASTVHAQVVLISSHYTNTVTGAIPLTLPQTSTTYVSGSFGTATATTYGTQTTMMPYSVQRSDFGAVYFVKTRQRVGIIAAPLDDATRKRIGTNSGVIVRIVVDGSPAFVADIFPGDILLAVNSDRVQSPEQYAELLNQYEGQTTTFHLNRDGQAIEKTFRIASYQDSM
jgi:C-terminal processing protease CtpA/Prc